MAMSMLEIIAHAWRQAGKKGAPTVAFIKRWRAENPLYGRHSLRVRFESGSSLALKPRTALDLASEAWHHLHPDVKFDPMVHKAEVDALWMEFRAKEAELERLTRPEGKPS